MKEKKTNRLSYATFRVIRWIIQAVYPKITVVGEENLPAGGCIVVGNHTQMNGPICGEIYFPGQRKIWCAGQMMHLKEVPPYAFQDFWGLKPKWTHPFFKAVSYLIAPLSVAIFTNARTIPVYHDGRLLTTFKKTTSELESGTRVIIYPECYEKYNHIVYRFQDRFIDVAKLYHRRTGRALAFVPMYIAPKLKKLYIGKPTYFDANAPSDGERQRICTYLMDAVTQMAEALPEHTVIPYANISKKLYGTNRPPEVKENEKTGC